MMAKKVVAIYDYIDGRGKVLYQNVRYEPKDFRQRRPDGNGGWLWNLDGTRRILYRLRELLQTSMQDFVCVTEGEGKCDRLRELGFSVTTSGSATSWRPEFAEYFKGRLVCVLPDNNLPGKRYAKVVVESLQGVAAVVKVVELPGLKEDEDVKDWLDNGGTAADLTELIDKAEPYEPQKVENDVTTKAVGTFHLTDSGNGERFAVAHSENVHYVWEWERWLVFDGQRWNLTTGQAEVEKFTARVARSMLQEAENCSEEERRAIIKWSLSSESASRRAAMLTCARSVEPIPAYPAQFDKCDMLFNCANGTIELATGRLRPHRASDMITKLSPVEYDEDAVLPLWDEFLRKVTGNDRAMLDFLQMAVGYSLTGSTAEEKIFFCHGPTATGKSTFLESVKSALGDYAVTADFESFLQRSQVGAARNDIAGLHGARFVASIEVEEGKRLAEGLVKMLSGGDTVRARFLYRESFEFLPKFKLWLAANAAPRASDTDDALWRRILRVPFEHVIPESERDPKVKATLRDPKVAGPAILAWAVRGCLMYQKLGLVVPDSVTRATLDYRQSQDPLREFFDDECEFDSAAFVPVAEMRKMYEAFCEENGIVHPLGAYQFNKRLEERGCKRVPKWFTNEMGTAKQAKAWQGVGLRNEPKVHLFDEK